MNVLITGGSGLFAVNWARSCRGFQKITLGLHERQIEIDGVKARKINLDSQVDLIGVLKSERIDLVIHCVAITNIELCEQDSSFSSYVNVQLTENVARATQIFGCRLIYISTDMLFSGVKSMITEEEAVAPVNLYGKTKCYAECTVLDICSDPLIIRTNFYGWGTGYRKSLTDWIIESLRDNREIKLFTDIIFTPILLGTLIRLINTLVDRNKIGVFNVVGNERLSKYDFGLRVAEKFGLDKKFLKKSRFSDRNDLIPRPFDMSLSNAKLKCVLNTCVPSLDQDLTTLLDSAPTKNRE